MEKEGMKKKAIKEKYGHSMPLDRMSNNLIHKHIHVVAKSDWLEFYPGVS